MVEAEVRSPASCVYGTTCDWQREVLVLIAYEGHSIAEAAGVLEISEQNVRTTLHLAREKLRTQLTPYLDLERQTP